MAFCHTVTACNPSPQCAPCPMRVRYVGVPKIGPILCSQGVDEPSPTEILHRVRYRSVLSHPQKMSVGVLQSVFASNDKALYFDDSEMNGQRYAMCLKAFALLHIVPVYKWTRKMLDNLLLEGAELYSMGPDESTRKSNDMGFGRDDTLGGAKSVYNINEQGVRRSFKLEGYEFEVELGRKFSPSQDDLGTGDSPPDIHVVGLKPALHAFFKKRKFCLLSTFNLYLFIWKEEGVYFVLDFYGRNTQLEAARDGGYATLVCMREIRSVDYLITQKSNLGKKDTFLLREMRLLMLVDPEGRALMSYFDASRADEFVRVSSEYAYLKSKLHLSLKEKNPLLSRCGLPVGVAAIISSKIDHPASWDSKNLSKIVCHGFFICQCCWEYCQTSQVPIDYDSFPNQLQIGQFAVTLTIIPKIAQGLWRCVPRYQATDLTNAITKCYQTGQNYLLLTINQQTYAIWKKNGFYYLFDPYRHRLPNTDSRSASLRMFGTLEAFFKVLNLILLQSNSKSPFLLHRVVVTDIRVSIGVECLPSVPKPPCADELVEAKSINEGICFREDYKRCWEDLGQLSDDEEEDSVIEEVEEEESEKEPPDVGEEGEYDYEDVEWSDEDGGPKGRRGRRGRRGGRGGKFGPGGKRFGKGKGGKGGKGGGGKGAGKGGKAGAAGKGSKKGKGKGGLTDDAGGRRSRSRASRAHGSRSRGSRSRGSRSRGSRSRESSSRRSRSRGSRSRRSRSRGSRRGSSYDDYRGSRSRGVGRGSRGRGSRGRGSHGRGSHGRGSRSRRSRSRGSRGSARGSRGRYSRDRSGRRDDYYDRDRRGDGRGGDEGDGRWDRDRSGRRGDRDYDDYDYDRDGRRRRGDGEYGDGIGADGEKYDRDRRDDGYGGYGSERYGRGKYDGGKGDGGTDGYGRSGDGYGRDGYGRDGYGRDGYGRDGYGRDGRGGDRRGDRYGTGGSGYEEDPCVKERFDVKGSKEDSGLSTAYSQLQDGYGEDPREGTVCRPNAYPGYRAAPFNLAVAGSETGTLESLCKLLRAGFKYADRVLTMTPFGNFVVFRGCSSMKKTYFVFDGCTCNVERFRHLDLKYGTAGLICFNSLHCAITYMLDTRHLRRCVRKKHSEVVDEICSRYCK